MNSEVTADQVRSQAVFPGRVVPLVGLHNSAGLRAGLSHYSWSGGASGCAPQPDGAMAGLRIQAGPHAGLCNQMKPQVVLCQWAGLQAML